jgi:two-component system, chemotaxis family, response regulator PixG
MLAEYITLDGLATQLSQIKQQLFSGSVLLKNPQGQEWHLYFYLGRILYATGGSHPTRRWVRNCKIAAVDSSSAKNLQARIRVLTDISALTQAEMNSCWEYYLLVNWAKQSRITRTALVKHIQSTIIEVLFDLIQAKQVSWEVAEKTELSPQLTLIDLDRAFAIASQQQQQWVEANLTDILPDRGIEIFAEEEFRQLVNQAAYPSLQRVLDGQHSLREIALKTRKSPLSIGTSFLAHIRSGYLKVVDLADFEDPVKAYNRQLGAAPALIACIDDSPFICDRLEQIFRGEGYNFMGILDSTRAIPLAIAKKPQLIFLDLVMPNTNGYEICSRLRKVKAFRHTPIIILTGNDGVIDRVRAKVVGATDFLTKPIQAELVLEIAKKYLTTVANESN